MYNADESYHNDFVRDDHFDENHKGGHVDEYEDDIIDDEDDEDFFNERTKNNGNNPNVPNVTCFCTKKCHFLEKKIKIKIFYPH